MSICSFSIKCGGLYGARPIVRQAKMSNAHGRESRNFSMQLCPYSAFALKLVNGLLNVFRKASS